MRKNFCLALLTCFVTGTLVLCALAQLIPPRQNEACVQSANATCAGVCNGVCSKKAVCSGTVIFCNSTTSVGTPLCEHWEGQWCYPDINNLELHQKDPCRNAIHNSAQCMGTAGSNCSCGSFFVLPTTCAEDMGVPCILQ